MMALDFLIQGRQPLGFQAQQTNVMVRETGLTHVLVKNYHYYLPLFLKKVALPACAGSIYYIFFCLKKKPRLREIA